MFSDKELKFIEIKLHCIIILCVGKSPTIMEMWREVLFSLNSSGNLCLWEDSNSHQIFASRFFATAKFIDQHEGFLMHEKMQTPVPK